MLIAACEQFGAFALLPTVLPRACDDVATVQCLGASAMHVPVQPAASEVVAVVPVERAAARHAALTPLAYVAILRVPAVLTLAVTLVVLCTTHNNQENISLTH